MKMLDYGGVGLWRCWTMGCWTMEMLDYGGVGLLRCWTIEVLDY